ncbi:MAG TPA: hypothetical protein VG167_21925 [Verrucomicrobiae bacterium]|nr:hypothetical protein [Verrucomicrobiae bacterium]
MDAPHSAWHAVQESAQRLAPRNPAHPARPFQTSNASALKARETESHKYRARVLL